MATMDSPSSAITQAGSPEGQAALAALATTLGVEATTLKLILETAYGVFETGTEPGIALQMTFSRLGYRFDSIKFHRVLEAFRGAFAGMFAQSRDVSMSVSTGFMQPTFLVPQVRSPVYNVTAPIHAQCSHMAQDHVISETNLRQPSRYYAPWSPIDHTQVQETAPQSAGLSSYAPDASSICTGQPAENQGTNSFDASLDWCCEGDYFDVMDWETMETNQEKQA